MAHEGVPNYLQQRRIRHEARIEAHARRVTEHIETRMKKRGMLRDGEKLEDAQRRYQEMRKLKKTEQEELVVRERVEEPKPAHHSKK